MSQARYLITVEEEDMELLHNALFVYDEYLSKRAEETSGRDIKLIGPGGPITFPINDFIINTQMRVRELRERLVEQVGRDMTEEG